MNFPDSENTTQNISNLISQLQTIAGEDRNDLAESPNVSLIDEYIPLFIGISQNGGSYPYDQIIDSLSSIPSQMAIGATWNTLAASDVGKLVGSELEAIGINLFLGPSLDVLDISYSKEKEYLGVRTFGGDPYWVGEMGAAYMAQGVVTLAGSRMYTSMADTDEIIDEALDRFESVLSCVEGLS